MSLLMRTTKWIYFDADQINAFTDTYTKCILNLMKETTINNVFVIYKMYYEQELKTICISVNEVQTNSNKLYFDKRNTK